MGKLDIIIKQTKKRYQSMYNDTQYGRPFLSGRFLKMSESRDGPQNTVFDKRNSEFIPYWEAVLEHKIQTGVPA